MLLRDYIRKVRATEPILDVNLAIHVGVDRHIPNRQVKIRIQTQYKKLSIIYTIRT